MSATIKICIAIKDNHLAEEASQLCAAQGWSVITCPVESSNIGVLSANFILFDDLTDLPAVRQYLQQSIHQQAVYLANSDSVEHLDQLGFPERCYAMNQDTMANELIGLLTTTLNVARFDAQFFNTQDAEPITQLPHHTELLQYVQRYMGKPLGLIVVEIDHAEHLYADLDPVSKTDLLSALSHHLQACLPHHAHMAIYDAASFAIWCPDTFAQDIALTANNLCERACDPLTFRGGQLHFSLSAGAAHENAFSNPQHLWQQAWNAKEKSKLAGGNQANLSSDEKSLGERIPQALSREEFGLVVQPQWNIQGTELRGVETLLRWQGMEVGNIAPDRFIPIAERQGQMARVGDWVLERACTASAAWFEHHVKAMLLGVNVSPQQFVQQAIVTQVERLAKDQWLNPSILELELAHSNLLQVVDQHRSSLFKLRDMGVRIAIDNLGTGVVDTNKLLRCPADTIKIDRALIANVTQDDAARRLVAQICQVGQRFNLRVVAVGVETQAQRQLLENLGCTDAQGFLFSQPVPLEAFRTYLTEIERDKNNQSDVAGA